MKECGASLDKIFRKYKLVFIEATQLMGFTECTGMCKMFLDKHVASNDLLQNV